MILPWFLKHRVVQIDDKLFFSLTSDQLLSLGLQPGGRFIVSRQSSQSVENSEEADERCIGSYEDPSLTMNITSCSAVLEVLFSWFLKKLC